MRSAHPILFTLMVAFAAGPAAAADDDDLLLEEDLENPAPLRGELEPLLGAGFLGSAHRLRNAMLVIVVGEPERVHGGLHQW